MTTVLFFQDLARIATNLSHQDVTLKWPNKQWKFTNSLSVPSHVNSAEWNERYDNFYGYSR